MESYLQILITIASLGALMFGMLKFMLRDIYKELHDIRSDIGELKEAQKKAEIRIDHLYQICIEMLLERKKS